MPLYEYVCEQDGTTLELLRPMSRADDPVEDPEGRGRVFVRKHSTFQVNGGAVPSARPTGGGGCSCGRPHGPCHG